MREQERITFYQTIPGFWYDVSGTPYALYDTYGITQDNCEELRLATTRVDYLFRKIRYVLEALEPEQLMALGYPPESIPYIVGSHSQPFTSIIGRYDFVAFDGTYKVLEYNSDTPTFIAECFSVNGKVCHHFGEEDVNKGEEEVLRQGIADAIRDALGEFVHEATIVFTAHGDSKEDVGTVNYLQSLCPFPSRFIPLEELRVVPRKGLFTTDEEQIHLLYRQTYPIETMIHDKDKDGTPVGQLLLELVQEGKLHVINPLSSFLLQNKGVQAVIWKLHEEGNPFFTVEEHEWIKKYFLPTYMEATPFVAKGLYYVKKPVFGREGDTVEIVDEKGEIVNREGQKSYAQFSSVYQAYISLPTRNVWCGEEQLSQHLLYGAFVIGGKSSSIGCRAGGQITTNTSYFLPMHLVTSEEGIS